MALTTTPPERAGTAIHTAVAGVRSMQRRWTRTSVSERLTVVRDIRDLIAARAPTLAGIFPPSLERRRAETLTSEIIPLAEACRFLENEAERILKPCRRSKSGRPLWLRGVEVRVFREPLGVVLVIGPSNYPLFLPAVQSLQALVAGNGVILKPGREARGVIEAFRSLIVEAGIPAGLVHVLDESAEAGISAIREGVDKIVLTGNTSSGKAVLREAAESITPAIMELSGNDPVFILESADLCRAADAVFFGLILNRGYTCIAPRRVFVLAKHQTRFQDLLNHRLQAVGAPHEWPLITAVQNDDEAIELASDSDYALGATIFGNPYRAAKLAPMVSAGVIVINDLIVPTADPRVPFGGRKLSGFGSTRGEEGLLEMTTTKAVITQKAKRLRHLEYQLPNTADLSLDDLFLAFLCIVHRRAWKARFAGCLSLIRALWSRAL